MYRVTLWLSFIMIFVIPWENALNIPGVGTASKALGLLVAIFWAATVLVTGRLRKPNLFHWVVFLFILWNIASAFWSIDVDATLDRIQTYFQLLILVIILWDLYTTPDFVRAGLQAYVLGAYVSIVSMFANYLNSSVGDPIRYTAAGFNDNDLGLILALGIPVAWYLANSESTGRMSRVLRLVNYAYIPAAGLAILLTASRGSFVATLPAFLFVLLSLTWLKLRVRVLLFVVLVGSFLVIQPLVPHYSIDRLATTGSSIAEGDLTGRVEIWRQGWDALSEHSFFGVGSGAFRTAVESGKVAHNVFVSILVEVGPIGLGLFVTLLVIAVYQALQQPKWEAGLWLTILLVWTLGATVHTWEQRKQTWLFLSMVIVATGLSAPRDESVTSLTPQKKLPPVKTRKTEEAFLE